MVQIVLTSASTSPWVAPGDGTYTIEIIGRGGKGAAGTTVASGASGGSGCYGIWTGKTMTNGQSFVFSIPGAGGSAAKTTWDSGALQVDFGTDASGTTAGLGGLTANCVGAGGTFKAGTNGANGIGSTFRAGPAGPGAPGPQGLGAVGGTVSATQGGAGAPGGGAANGGGAGGAATAGAGAAGGLGGNGFDGTGAGAAGAAAGGAGGNGTTGKGAGGGGGGGITGNAHVGGLGGNGSDDTANSGYAGFGPGGGGGGGGGDNGATSGTGGAGGNGGTGAGGGGGGAASTTGGAGGVNGGGLIVITYTLSSGGGGTQDLAGDFNLDSSSWLAASSLTTGTTKTFIGDCAPTTDFGGDLTVSSGAPPVDLAGDLSPSVTLSADFSGFIDLTTGFLAPSTMFSAALSNLIDLSTGDLSPTTAIAFSATLTGFVDLAGNLSPSVAYSGGISTGLVNISFGSRGPAINPNLWGINYSWNIVPQATFPTWNTMYENSIGCLSYTHPSGWNGENYLWQSNTMNAWNNWVPGTAVGEAVVPFVAAVAPGTVTSVLPAEDYILGRTNPATSAPWTLADMVARIQAIFTGGYLNNVVGVILGNEFWNYAGASNPTTRAALLQSYCTLAANIIPWIRTNYPGMKIYVTGQWLIPSGGAWVYGTDFVTLKNSITAISPAAWAAVDGICIHNYAGTDTTAELWSQIAPTVAQIIADTGKVVISTEWAATKDRTDQDSGHNYKFGIKNTQVMLLCADQMAKSGVQAASFWPDCFSSVNIAMADATFTVVQFNGQLMNWLAHNIQGTYLNINSGGLPAIAADNGLQVTLILAAAQDGQVNVTLALGTYTGVSSATVMYHPTPNTNTNDYTALTTTLPVTVAGGNATFSLNIGGAGRGPGWEIALLTLTKPITDLAGDMSVAPSFAADLTPLVGVGSAYGKNAYGKGMYSRQYPAGTVDLVGDLPVVPALAGSALISTLFLGAVGGDADMAPSIVFAANLATSAPLDLTTGDLSPSIAFGVDVTFFSDLAGGVDLSIAVNFNDSALSLDIFLSGDLAPSTAFGGDMSSLPSTSMQGDISTSVVFNTDLSVDPVLAGDLAPSVAFSGDPGSLIDLSGGFLSATPAFAAVLAPLVDLSTGDLSPSIVFAADVTVSLALQMSGDLSPSIAYTGDLADLLVLASDLAPNVQLSANLTIGAVIGGSAYGKNVYGRGPYSKYAPGFQDFVGDLAPSISLAGTFGLLPALAGDVSPSVVLAGDFDINNQKTINGNLAPSVVFSATLSSATELAGDLAPSVVFNAILGDLGVLAGGLSPSVSLGGNLTLAGWQPEPPCPPVDWKEVEPCDG